LLAAAWGFGALLATPASKFELSELLTASAAAQPTVVELLAEGYPVAKPGMSLHDHCLDLTTGVWQPWKDVLRQQAREPAGSETPEDAPVELPEGADPRADSVLVPTEDTLRFRYLLDQLTRRSVPVCLLGGTGSGKTSLVKEYLTAGLQPAEWELGQLVLSATTSAASVQGYIESKLEK